MGAIDRKVLSVPAGITYGHLTEHNVYSCPVDWPEHDFSVPLIAPRDSDGRMYKVCVIKENMIARPTNLLFHSKTSMEAIDAVRGYVSAVSHIPGILDNGGEYRFYYLKDLENGRLAHGPRINLAGPVHRYVSLRALLSAIPIVQVLEDRQEDQQIGYQDIAGNEVVDSKHIPDNLTLMHLPQWIQHLWDNARDQGVTAAKEIWHDRHNYFKWPEASRVLSTESSF
jgi:hypothetical protein